MKNILITSVGKRVSLTRKFMKELKEVFSYGKVFTCDMDPKIASAGYVSDECFRVPRCTSEDYVETLLTLCLENEVNFIIPTIDIELAILSANKDIFAKQGIKVIVSDFDFVTMSLDKRKTPDYLREYQIDFPKLIAKDHPKFPMFVKPYDGSLSKNTHVVCKLEELTEEIKNDKKLIYMEYVDQKDYKEFTVDMYYGRDNRVKSIVPRERLEVRAGEISKGVTRKNYLVGFLKERMNYLPGVVGCICIQLFYRESDHDVKCFEINARFGGGYPLSYCAGANYPKMLLQEYMLGESLKYTDDWRDNTLMLRYDDEVIVYDVEA